MPPKSKGATSPFPLRMTPEERALVETVQAVYGRSGVEMSLNEVIRHLIRRSGIVPACTVGGAQTQLNEHVKNCAECADSHSGEFACPEGVYLHRNYRRVLRAHSGSEAAPKL